jgi:hypothetical protein
MSSEANNEAPSGDSLPSDTQGPDHASPVPSVMIDPSLLAEAAPTTEPDPPVAPETTAAASPAEPSTQPAEAEAVTTAPAEGTDTPAAPPASNDDDGEWAAGGFSDDDADRFADAMRPTWDTAPVETAADWAAAGSGTHGATPHTAAATFSPDDSSNLRPVVLKKSVDRRVLIGAAVGAAAILAALWSLVGGESDAPPKWNETGAATTTSQAAPAASPPPSPVVPSVPAPIAPPTPSAPIAVATPTPAVTPAPTPTQAPVPVAPTKAPAPPARRSVHVRIATTPASADLRLDGEVVPNPFDAFVAQGGSHTVVASAEGYEQRSWSIGFDQDQTLSLVLKHVPVRQPPPRHVKRAAPRPAPRNTPRPSPSPSRPRGAGFVTDNPY